MRLSTHWIYKIRTCRKIAFLMDYGRILKGIITEITQKNDKSYWLQNSYKHINKIAFAEVQSARAVLFRF